jgi:ferric-dicitrate binding protein FerR (iron transport regulator)
MDSWKANPRETRGRAALAALGWIAAVLLSGSEAAAAEPRIESLRGVVEVGAGEPERWRPASAGDALGPGDAVRTGKDGRAEIRLRTGVVRLYENSLLRLPTEAPTRASSERVRMDRGRSLFDVLRRSAEDRFEVETPEVAVMVKGTRFAVALGDGEASVSVWRGSVGVRALVDRLDREILVRPGFAAVSGAGGAFELVLQRADDPWDAWSRGVPAPDVPRLDRHADGAEGLALARLAALAEIERALGIRGESVLDRARQPKESAPPAAPDPAQEPLVDPTDAAGELLNEAFAAGAVAGTTAPSAFDVQVLESGGPDRVVITGPGISDTLTEDDIETILETGNTSLLSSGLLNQLNQTGTDVLQFVQQLGRLL